MEVPLGHPDFGKIEPCQCRQTDLRDKRLKELRKVSNMDALAHYQFESFKPEGMGELYQKDRSLASAYEAARGHISRD